MVMEGKINYKMENPLSLSGRFLCFQGKLLGFSGAREIWVHWTKNKEERRRGGEYIHMLKSFQGNRLFPHFPTQIPSMPSRVCTPQWAYYILRSSPTSRRKTNFNVSQAVLYKPCSWSLIFSLDYCLCIGNWFSRLIPPPGFTLHLGIYFHLAPASPEFGLLPRLSDTLLLRIPALSQIPIWLISFTCSFFFNL